MDGCCSACAVGQPIAELIRLVLQALMLAGLRF